MPQSGPRIGIACLPINPSLRYKLQCAGFRTLADLIDVQPGALASACGISQSEACALLELALSCSPPALTVNELLSLEDKPRPIFTFCSDIDKMLGGGVPMGQVTEFCGVPGVGKTQIGMQLAIDVQLPAVFDGQAGQAVYLDTEGSFAPKRAAQMAEIFIKSLKKIGAAKNDAKKIEAAAGMTADSVLSNIHYFRLRDAVEQLAAIQHLPTFLNAHPSIKLVIIDSVTFHFRQDFADMAVRSRLLAHMAQQLMALAAHRGIAVVLMNQVTTKSLGTDQTVLVPALGDSWGHAATHRVLLYWKEGQRRAALSKSPSYAASDVEYFVTEEGVRGRAQLRKRTRSDTRRRGEG